MKRNTTISALLLSGFLVACGGAADGEVVEDQAEEMAEAAGGAAEMAMLSGPESCFLARGTLAEAAERPSPLMSIDLAVDGGSAVLCWGAPSVKGREMIGGQDPFGTPWRMGANEATAIHLDVAANLGGIALAPGSYSIYGIPNADQWEIFVNGTAERWGVPINAEVQATDMGSFMVTPEEIDLVETLMYSQDGGDIVMEFENTRVRLPFGAGM